ncbi:MAG TPA: cytochrome P450 [Acidimicrobiales bacterium]|nr:cytochrome P450 [Acidimicrobiales bacterium]
MEVDLSDPQTYVAGVPHDWFAHLRAHDPVHWQPAAHAAPGYWALTRYDDVVTVSRDPSVFSSFEGTALLEDMRPEGLWLMRQQLIHMDPPDHTNLRKIVNHGFTPRMIRQLGEHVAEITAAIVDAVAPKGECDFVTEIAAELPLQVIAELLGVPHEDRWKLFDWSNRLIGLEDPEYGGGEVDAGAALMEMFMYAAELAQDRRSSPRDDIVSVLVHAEVEGAKLTDTEFNMFFFLLVIAGNETTRNLLSGGMLALCEHPDQRARLATESQRAELLPKAVEEMLRWVTPVMYFRRTALRDTVVGGQEVKAGERVVMYYGSANRDEAVFGPTASAFDVGREPNNHVAFGFGTHFCLGASLARLEIRTAFEEVLRRMPDLEVAGPVERLRSNLINGIKHLPVRFTPTNA